MKRTVVFSFTSRATDAIHAALPGNDPRRISLPNDLIEFPHVGDKVTFLVLDPLEFVLIERRLRVDQDGLSEVRLVLDLDRGLP